MYWMKLVYPYLTMKKVIKGNNSSLFLSFLKEPYFRVINSSEWGKALLYRFLADKCRSYICLALLGHSSWQKSAAMLWGPSSSPLKESVWWGARSLAHSYVRAPSWKWLLQPQSDLQMTAAPDANVTATSWEVLSHPAKPLPNSWPSETECLLF